MGNRYLGEQKKTFLLNYPNSTRYYMFWPRSCQLVVPRLVFCMKQYSNVSRMDHSSPRLRALSFYIYCKLLIDLYTPLIWDSTSLSLCCLISRHQRSVWPWSDYIISMSTSRATRPKLGFSPSTHFDPTMSVFPSIASR